MIQQFRNHLSEIILPTFFGNSLPHTWSNIQGTRIKAAFSIHFVCYYKLNVIIYRSKSKSSDILPNKVIVSYFFNFKINFDTLYAMMMRINFKNIIINIFLWKSIKHPLVFNIIANWRRLHINFIAIILVATSHNLFPLIVCFLEKNKAHKHTHDLYRWKSHI